MAFVNLYTFPPLIPIPKLDAHVIGGGQDERLRGMDDDSADVVGMGFEGGNFFRGIVVVDANLEVIGAAYYPILAGHEAASSDGYIGKLERFDDRL